MQLWLSARMTLGNHVLDEGADPPEKGQFWGKRCPLESIWTFCYELCKNG